MEAKTARLNEADRTIQKLLYEEIKHIYRNNQDTLNILLFVAFRLLLHSKLELSVKSNKI